MAEKANVPEIRFAGFADPWEQRKLGNLFSYGGSGGTPSVSNDSFYGGKIPFLGISDVKGRDISQTAKHITEKGLAASAAWVVPSGAVCLAMYASVGKVGIIRQNTATSQAFFNMVFDNDGTRDFVYSRLERAELTAEWEELISTGTQRNLNANKVRDFMLAVPAETEQRLIGQLFSRLDALITLHQRKYDKLGELKKSLLEKMFPKEGEIFPEIRFAGFADPWEQRKLGDIAQRVTRKNESCESDLPLTISAQYGLVDQRTYFNTQVASKDMSGYYLLYRGEFAYNKSTSADSPWGAVKQLVGYNKGCVSTLYICFALHDADPEYLVAYYETDRWHKGIQKIAAEGARNHGLLNISPDDFFESKLIVPKQQSEQRLIGQLFSRLDTLITLHQRKLELLRNIKKALLDKMFVEGE